MIHAMPCHGACPESCVLSPISFPASAMGSSRAPKKAAKEAPSASPTTTAPPPGLGPDPFLQPLPIGHHPGIGDLCLQLGLTAIEAQERRHAPDEVGHTQVAAQDVWAVVLDLAEGHAALLLADAS